MTELFINNTVNRFAIIHILLKLWMNMRPRNLGRVMVLDGSFYNTMTGGFTLAPNPDLVSRWTRQFPTGEHLLHPIISVMYYPGHWIFVCILPGNHSMKMNPENDNVEIHFFDGLDIIGPREMNGWTTWYRSQMDKYHPSRLSNLQIDAHYHRDYKLPGNDIKQLDNVSCGPIAVLLAYYFIVLNCFANNNNFNTSSMTEVRLWMSSMICKAIEQTVVEKQRVIDQQAENSNSNRLPHAEVMDICDDDAVVFIQEKFNDAEAQFEDDIEDAMKQSLIDMNIAYNEQVFDCTETYEEALLNFNPK
jgi:hypothetical protein